MLTELSVATDKLVGAKQVRRALSEGRAKKIFLAQDADPGLTEPLATQSSQADVSVVWVPSMKALGVACGISVGAAVAAIV